MQKFSACVELLKPDCDFYQAIREAKKFDFEYIEFWGWDNKDLNKTSEICKELELGITSISGDGRQYSLCDDSHMEGYIDYAVKSMEAAKRIDCETIVIHSNALGEGGVVLNHYENWSKERKYMNMVRTLLKLAPIAEDKGISCVLEPLNTKVDHVGNALANTDDACEITRLVRSPKIKVLYDMYHMQIMHGDIIPIFSRNIDQIGHIHIADNPGRNEPGTGELNFKNIIAYQDKIGYKGYTAFELSPNKDYEDAVKSIMALH